MDRAGKVLLGFFLAVAVPAIVLTVLFSANAPPPREPPPGEPPAPEEPDKPDISGLKYVCREYVRESLLAPATAEFQPTRKMAAGWLGDNRAAVEAYVDAQNGFGALIRTNYRCEALSRGNGRWTLVDVSVLD